jgi:hypothetical protein
VIELKLMLMNNFIWLLLITIYISFPDESSYPIVQQPQGEYLYVSSRPDVITQFTLPQDTIWLLAHNYLLGDKFLYINVGDTVTIYKDNIPTRYIITDILSFKAHNNWRTFTNLNTNKTYSSTELFHYIAPNKLVLQTCIQDEWGVMFWIANLIKHTIYFPLVNHAQENKTTDRNSPSEHTEDD